jgi:predicted enzyme related to lactoylglutathione lyase
VGNRTSYEPGTFSWVELATTDQEAAKSFYGGLFGWEAEDNEIPEGGGVYSMMKVAGRNAAAITGQPEQQRSAGVPPNWFSYVTVASADESAERAKELGGAVHAGPFDVMDAGRMAVIADPAGAMFGLWEANESIGAEVVNAPGALSWNDVATTDPGGAQDFYSGLFGWGFEKMETGPEGPDYWTITHDGGSNGRNGGMRGQVAQEVGHVPPHVAPYFGTGSIEESVAKVQELGGGSMVPVTEVPAGKFAGVSDPQGAAFMLFEGEFDD